MYWSCMPATNVIREFECLPEPEVRKVLDWAIKRIAGERRVAALDRVIKILESSPGTGSTEEDVLNWPRHVSNEGADRR